MSHILVRKRQMPPTMANIVESVETAGVVAQTLELTQDEA
jgi:hypothetical protein